MMIDAAIHLSSSGIPIFPVKPDKKPDVVKLFSTTQLRGFLKF